MFGAFYCTSLTRCKSQSGPVFEVTAAHFAFSAAFFCPSSWSWFFCSICFFSLSLWLGPVRRSVYHRHNGEVFTAAPNSMRTLEEIWVKPKNASHRPCLCSRVCEDYQSLRPPKIGAHRIHHMFHDSRRGNPAVLRSFSRPLCFCDRVLVKLMWNALRWVKAVQASLHTGAGRALVRSCALDCWVLDTQSHTR